MKTVKIGYFEEDDLNNVNELRNYNDDYVRNVKQGYLPNSLKTKNFSKATIFRFNQYFGKFFGVFTYNKSDKIHKIISD